MKKKDHQLGDGPIDPQFKDMMITLASDLDHFFNGDARGSERPVGYVLMVFPFNSTDGRCNYISNGADRNDIVALMREQIARFEGQAGGLKGRA